MIKKLIHFLEHLFKQNKCDVVTWKENGFLHFGIKCKECGSVESVNKIFYNESEIDNG